MTQVDRAPAQASARLLEYEAEDQFDMFFRASYRKLLKTALYAGAREQEAEDAISAAMEDVLSRWGQVDQPHAYARRAMLSHFYKARTRCLDRIRLRQVERGHVPCDDNDPALTVWEDQEWVDQMLASLPPTQRQVMDGVLADLTTAEISELLGKTPAAVRQNLHDARVRLKAVLLREQAEASPGSASVLSGKEAR